jgi:Icc-related predicted phosphoesterase
MSFWKRSEASSGNKRLRLFYATDVHGSERTFRKFINAAKFYKVHHLVLGGDIMGKYLVPIVDEGGGHYRVTLQEELQHLDSDSAVAAVRERIETLGFYHITVKEDELREMQADQRRVDETFKRLAHERLERWIALADERLEGSEVKCYVTGGNDDPQDLLDVVKGAQSEHVVYCEGEIVRLDESYPMASCGFSNPTPWDTPRETDEDELEKLLEEAVAGISDFTSAVFNMHVPPYDCTLDDCPKLDWSTDPPTPVVIAGVPQSAPAGSTAVRKIVEKYQPLMLLTGHIHESRGLVKIGRTTVVNPGSEYGEGILRGCIISLEPGKVVGYQMTSG